MDGIGGNFTPMEDALSRTFILYLFRENKFNKTKR